jgi:hypothetical protein
MELIMYKGPRLWTAVAIIDRVGDVFKLQPKSKIETSTLPKVKAASIILQQYDLFTRIKKFFSQRL